MKILNIRSAAFLVIAALFLIGNIQVVYAGRADWQEKSSFAAAIPHLERGVEAAIDNAIGAIDAAVDVDALKKTLDDFVTAGLPNQMAATAAINISSLATRDRGAMTSSLIHITAKMRDFINALMKVAGETSIEGARDTSAAIAYADMNTKDVHGVLEKIRDDIFVDFLKTYVVNPDTDLPREVDFYTKDSGVYDRLTALIDDIKAARGGRSVDTTRVAAIAYASARRAMEDAGFGDLSAYVTQLVEAAIAAKGGGVGSGKGLATDARTGVLAADKNTTKAVTHMMVGAVGHAGGYTPPADISKDDIAVVQATMKDAIQAAVQEAVKVKVVQDSFAPRFVEKADLNAAVTALVVDPATIGKVAAALPADAAFNAAVTTAFGGTKAKDIAEKLKNKTVFSKAVATELATTHGGKLASVLADRANPFLAAAISGIAAAVDVQVGGAGPKKTFAEHVAEAVQAAVSSTLESTHFAAGATGCKSIVALMTTTAGGHFVDKDADGVKAVATVVVDNLKGAGGHFENAGAAGTRAVANVVKADVVAAAKAEAKTAAEQKAQDIIGNDAGGLVKAVNDKIAEVEALRVQIEGLL